MQVFVWDGPSSSSVSVLPLAQNLPHGLAEFGPANFDMSGAVVLADDGDATPTDACAALVGSVAGQIALVDRGSCTFKQKAVNVQAAGAVGMILANHTANEPPPFMPDASPAVPVTIPCVSITLGDGASLKASLAAGAASAALSRSSAPDRDGALDNTTVAHEWGHFLHLRQVACGAAICSAQSEGWADFVALLMMVEEGDDLGGAFPISQYATAGFPDDPAYFGIRRYPYSADFQKNPLTFRHIQSGEPLPQTAPVAPSGLFNDNAEVHAAGEIWASMLFEGYVSLLQQTKLATPPYTFEQARRRMADYVQAALVLAPPEPSYLEQRDALLAAAYAADESDFQLLAEAFARRGAGTCAVAPPKESQDFNGVVESFELRASATIVRASIDDDVSSCDDDGVLDAAERGTVTVELMNGGTSPLIGAKASIQSGSGDLSILEGKEIQLPLIEPLATFVATFEVALAESAKAKQKIEVVVTVDSPEGCTESAEIVLAPRTNLDEAAASSSIDDVETSTSAWKPKGSESDAIWSIDEEAPGEHVWRGRGHGSPSDTALVSPGLEVSESEPLVISFSHRHQFEASQGVYWDGGVVEVSVDNGQSWTDVSDFVDPGYGEIIGDPDDGAKNVLKDRSGFVAQNASWPEPDAVTLDFGSAFAGKTVRLRFRIGTDDAVGAHGWELDDLAFSGIDNTPFASLVPDGTTCASEGLPHADAGADLVVRSGETVSLDGSKSSDPDEQPLEFAWKQTLGVVAALEGVESAEASFIAPRTATPMHLTFQLTVTDGLTATSDTVDVLVNPDDSYRDGGPYQPGGGCGCVVGRTGTAPGLALSAALALLGLSRRRRNRA
jgi:MYXO-CTERM domain-containing protein